MATETKTICGVEGCDTCLPHRIAHWFCAQCGAGPYKFDAVDPGRFKVLRPHFERTKQSYVTNAEGIGRFVYDVRRVCSSACWQRERNNVRSDEVALMRKRPDLAPAITENLKADAEQDAQLWQDDLSPSAGQF